MSKAEEKFIEELNKEHEIILGFQEYEKKIADLEAKLAESEKKVKHWHDLYNERDKQFQSVRQRYHLLNKLQSNYDKKDKLHLAYMQCLELVEENEKLKQQLAEKDKEIEYQESMKILAVKNQNLTAIEQLEKVKENIHYLLSFDYNLLSKVNEQFDNQIKQLKELK